MITSQSFALEDFSHHFGDDSTQKLLDDSTQKLLDDSTQKRLDDNIQKLLDDNIQKLLDGISELPTGQVSIPINEGRTELVIEKAKDSTIHFGELLEEYVLTKHSELINAMFSNEIINAFSVKDADLKSDFLIVKYNGELHVRSFVASSDSEQRTPRLHRERLGLRLFGIITNHINENKETLSEKVPFEFIGKQFKFTYDGPEKKRFYIEEIKPRVIEVDPSIKEQNKPKSTTKKPKIIESILIPVDIRMKILGIHRTVGIDIETENIGKNTLLWNRIQDIAYGSENYDEQILKELRDVIQSFTTWSYKNSEDERKQEKWNDLIDILNEL